MRRFIFDDCLGFSLINDKVEEIRVFRAIGFSVDFSMGFSMGAKTKKPL